MITSQVLVEAAGTGTDTGKASGTSGAIWAISSEVADVTVITGPGRVCEPLAMILFIPSRVSTVMRVSVFGAPVLFCGGLGPGDEDGLFFAGAAFTAVAFGVFDVGGFGGITATPTNPRACVCKVQRPALLSRHCYLESMQTCQLVDTDCDSLGETKQDMNMMCCQQVYRSKHEPVKMPRTCHVKVKVMHMSAKYVMARQCICQPLNPTRRDMNACGSGRCETRPHQTWSTSCMPLWT